MKREKLGKVLALFGLVLNIIIIFKALYMQHIYMQPLLYNLSIQYQSYILWENILLSVVGVYLSICLIKEEITINMYVVVEVTLLIAISMNYYVPF